MEYMFSTRELCSLITACICHDLDHPGLNNAYQINAQTELAIRYKDKSPLENHHCRVTLDILSRPDCNILIGLPIDQQEAFRQDLSLLILATDMSRHNEILNAFTARRSQIQQLLKNVPARKPATETSMASSLPEKEDLSYLKMILIKACDVSNEIRPPKVAEPWAEKLLQEYFLQSAVEKKSGLPFAPFMDPDRVTKSTSQIGFIQAILQPLFETVSEVLTPLKGLTVANLNKALEYYKDLKEKEAA